MPAPATIYLQNAGIEYRQIAEPDHVGIIRAPAGGNQGNPSSMTFGKSEIAWLTEVLGDWSRKHGKDGHDALVKLFRDGTASSPSTT